MRPNGIIALCLSVFFSIFFYSVLVDPGASKVDAAASVSVSVVSPTAVGSNSTVTFTIQDDLGAPGPNDVSLTGTGPGYFSSANSIGANCGSTPPSGTNTTTITYSGACIDALDNNDTINNLTSSAAWLCTSAGTVTFTLTQAANTVNAGSSTTSLQCGTSSELGTVTLVAYPNVLPCVGTTEITATLRDPVGNPVPGVIFHFSTDVGLLITRTATTATLHVAPPMGSATVTAIVGGRSASVLVQVVCPELPTPVATPVVSTPVPQPASKLSLTASPSTIDKCGGSVFVAATVTDAEGRLVPDGTRVLFLATGGELNEKSGETVGGTATLTYAADEETSGKVSIRAQSGTAYGSVDVLVKCGDGVDDATATSGPSPLGRARTAGPPGSIRPPSTGNAGLLGANRP